MVAESRHTALEDYPVMSPMLSDRERESKLAELDRLLNDPETHMDPHKVWALLAEVSATKQSAAAPGRC